MNNAKKINIILLFLFIALVYQAHLAPVYSVQRNPFMVKNFLTIGDWTIKIWAEDFNQSPIMWTRPSKAQVS